ncbi:membrane protein [Amycolatopsis sp. NPDC004368]
MATSSLAAIDVGRGISDAWSTVATFVPKLLVFLIILVIGWLISKAIAKLVDKLLHRVGFDRLVERGGLKTMLDRSKFDASNLISKLLYYALLLITLQIAFVVWGPNPVSDLLTAIVAWLPRAAVAIIIIVVAAAIARAVKDLISGVLSGASYGKVLATIASIFIWGLGIIAAVNQIGIATTVTTPVLITVLATVGGIAVVGAGGGLIRPMQQRWTRWLDRADDEIPRAAEQARQRGREDAVARSDTPTEAFPTPSGTAGAPPRHTRAEQSGDEAIPPDTRL